MMNPPLMSLMREQGSNAMYGDSQRSVPTPFLTKTYQLVDDETIDHVISWNNDGSAFIVWNTRIFARDLLPKHFKHNNFTSFLRQLNTYGFKKIVSDRWEFSNNCFRRGNKQLLCEIQRRKFLTPVTSTTTTPTGVDAATPTTTQKTPSEIFGEDKVKSSNASPTVALSELIDENERLKKERVQLTEQLVEMKCLCNNIFVLMSNFAKKQSNSSFTMRESALKSTRSLNIFPVKQFPGDGDAAATEIGRSPIGAHTGAKRAREHRDGYSTSAEYDTTLRLQPPNRWEIKSEPLDYLHD